MNVQAQGIPASRSASLQSAARPLLPLVGFAAVVALWWLAIAMETLPPFALPSPAEVAVALLRLLGSPVLWNGTLLTLTGWVTSMAIVCLVAVPAGALLGRVRLLAEATQLPVEFLRAVPPISLIPAVVLMYGQTGQASVSIAVYAGLWPIFIQTLYGTRSIDPALYDVANSYRIPRSGAILHIIIPSILPYVFTGLRLSSALVLIALIGAEIIIGVPGIGNEINAARTGGNGAEAYALTIWTGIMGLAISSFINRLEPRAARARRGA